MDSRAAAPLTLSLLQVLNFPTIFFKLNNSQLFLYLRVKNVVGPRVVCTTICEMPNPPRVVYVVTTEDVNCDQCFLHLSFSYLLGCCICLCDREC